MYPENRIFIKILNLQNKFWINNTESEKIAFLNNKEKEIYSRYTLAKRAEEWLAGRVCAKLGVREFLRFSALKPEDIIIENDKTGRPYVSMAKDSSPEQPAGLDISISHSRNMACAMAADSYCGIDIQVTTDTLLKVADRYCHQREMTFLKEYFIEESHKALTLLWCSKEAIRKTCSHSFIPGFLELQLYHIDCLAEVFLFSFICAKDSGTKKVLCTTCNDYGLAICIDKGDLHA